MPVYRRAAAAAGRGAASNWVQLDEPILVTDLDADWRRGHEPRPRGARRTPASDRLVASYFGALGDNLRPGRGSVQGRPARRPGARAGAAR
ncbi:MAG: hypothetical protein U5L11_16680 [Arhodomonas sp.]|nr:hypothetical protein [Arhodomonas sp.]